MAVSGKQRELCSEVIQRIQAETDPFRQRMLIYYLLSHVGEFFREGAVETSPAPYYIIETLSYIKTHYAEKLVAADLARPHHTDDRLQKAYRQHSGKLPDRHPAETCPQAFGIGLRGAGNRGCLRLQ